MKQISRYILTLALLITAVGGAWADTTITWGAAELSSLTNDYLSAGATKTVNGITVTVNAGTNNFLAVTQVGTSFSASNDNAFTFSTELGNFTKIECTKLALNGTLGDGWDGATWTGNANSVNMSKAGSYLAVSSITFTIGEPAADPSAIEVTTDAAEEGATFTEASFTMPDYDATVGFDIVRDMSEQMTTKVGDAADGADYRIRLRKKDNAWELADIELADLKALITVTDGIENENLACFGQDAVCTLQIFAIDDNDQPTGDPISFADLEPGRYKAKAVAKADGDYIGETGLSNVIVLFQGYEVKVPAKEMITYYKDEPLYADTETSGDAELYTISSVSGDQVVLSDAIETAPSYTPLLVYNKGDQDKTFLLIPVDAEPNLALTVAPEFQGTLVARTTDDTSEYGPWNMAANTKYYGCNGNDFVWIKTDGNVDAHRCWIEISTANAPGRLTIVFEKEEATGVNEVSEVNEVSDDSWYDLSGRKLDGEPTTKGVYIKDGKKVIIK